MFLHCAKKHLLISTPFKEESDPKIAESLDEHCPNKASQEGENTHNELASLSRASGGPALTSALSLDGQGSNESTEGEDSLERFSSGSSKPASQLPYRGYMEQLGRESSSSELGNLTNHQAPSSSLLTQLLAPVQNAPGTLQDEHDTPEVTQTTETTQHPQQHPSIRSSAGLPSRSEPSASRDVLGNATGRMRAGGSKETRKEVRRAEKEMDERMKTWLEDHPMERLP